METNAETLARWMQQMREATNFALTYWKAILGIVRQLVANGEITMEQIGTTAEEVARLETVFAAVVPQ